MKLDDLFEGARDLDNRTLAASILREMEKQLKGRSPDRTVDSMHPHIVSIYDASKWDVPPELKEYFSKLRIKFRAAPGERVMYASFAKGNFDHITLFIPVPSARTVEQWEQTTAANASYWVKRHSENIYHEIIHLMDSHRYKDPEYFDKNAVDVNTKDYDEVNSQYVDYVNSPHEFNAYTQEVIHEFERKIGDTIDPKKVVQLSPGELYKLLIRPLMLATKSSLNDETKRRFAKRVNQLYYDIKKKYS